MRIEGLLPGDRIILRDFPQSALIVAGRYSELPWWRRFLDRKNARCTWTATRDLATPHFGHDPRLGNDPSPLPEKELGNALQSKGVMIERDGKIIWPEGGGERE